MSFPDKLRLRDTNLHDDLGGGGQRIFTTAGQGYEKKTYVRGDLYDALEEKLATLEHRWENIQPRHVIVIGEAGHYVNDAVKTHIDELEQELEKLKTSQKERDAYKEILKLIRNGGGSAWHIANRVLEKYGHATIES